MKPTATARMDPAPWRAFLRTLRAAMRSSGGDEGIRSPHHVVHVEQARRVAVGPRRLVRKDGHPARAHRVPDRHPRDEVDLLAAREPHAVPVLEGGGLEELAPDGEELRLHPEPALLREPVADQVVGDVLRARDEVELPGGVAVHDVLADDRSLVVADVVRARGVAVRGFALEPLPRGDRDRAAEPRLHEPDGPVVEEEHLALVARRRERLGESVGAARPHDHAALRRDAFVGGLDRKRPGDALLEAAAGAVRIAQQRRGVGANGCGDRGGRSESEGEEHRGHAATSAMRVATRARALRRTARWVAASERTRKRIPVPAKTDGLGVKRSWISPPMPGGSKRMSAAFTSAATASASIAPTATAAPVRSTVSRRNSPPSWRRVKPSERSVPISRVRSSAASVIAFRTEKATTFATRITMKNTRSEERRVGKE